MPEAVEHTFAKIQEHTPECAEMLVYISQADNDNPIVTNVEGQSVKVVFSDEEVTVITMACKLFADFRGALPYNVLNSTGDV